MNKTHHTPYRWKSDSWASYWNDSCAICMGLLHFRISPLIQKRKQNIGMKLEPDLVLIGYKTLLTVTKILILYRLFHDARAKFCQNKAVILRKMEWDKLYNWAGMRSMGETKRVIFDEWNLVLSMLMKIRSLGLVLNHFMSHVCRMSPALPDFYPYQYLPRFVAMELKPDLVFIAHKTTRNGVKKRVAFDIYESRRTPQPSREPAYVRDRKSILG